MGEGRAFHLPGARGILTFNMPQVMDQQSEARPSPPPLPFTLLTGLLDEHWVSPYWLAFPTHACSNFLVCLQGAGKIKESGERLMLLMSKCEAEPNSPVSPRRDQ